MKRKQHKCERYADKRDAPLQPPPQGETEGEAGCSLDVFAAVMRSSRYGEVTVTVGDRKLNDGDYKDAPYQIKRWNRAGGKVLDGLVRRREAEALLFKGEPWEDV